MTVHSRRALRATATLAGVAALGATFSGTAFAADQVGPARDRSDQDHKVRNDSSTDGYLGTASGDRARPADLGVGPTSELGLFDFALPTSGPAMAPTKKDNDSDDDNRSNPSSTSPHHYHPGANESPYDFDLYNPAETYGDNGCDDKGADRAPAYASEGGLISYGYNGNASDDCKVSSDDYDPKKTGYSGPKDKNYGYNGHTGTDPKRRSENKYIFALPGN